MKDYKYVTFWNTFFYICSRCNKDVVNNDDNAIQNGNDENNGNIDDQFGNDDYNDGNDSNDDDDDDTQQGDEGPSQTANAIRKREQKEARIANGTQEDWKRNKAAQQKLRRYNKRIAINTQ